MPPDEKLESLFHPLERTIIYHTRTGSCIKLEKCKLILQNIQKDDLAARLDDIAYNFLLDSYGRAYEGRGWNFAGSHTKG